MQGEGGRVEMMQREGGRGGPQRKAKAYVVHQTPQDWPPHKHRSSTQGEGFQNICPFPDTSVKVNFSFSIYSCHNLGQSIQLYSSKGSVVFPCTHSEIMVASISCHHLNLQ